MTHRLYDIAPVPKPRMTRSDKWKKRPSVVRYRMFCDEVRLMGLTVDPSADDITFHVPMPKSWSRAKRERMAGQPHEQVPDLDNYLKALLDACYEDDSGVWQLRGLRKRWAYTGAIEIHTQKEATT